MLPDILLQKPRTGQNKKREEANCKKKKTTLQSIFIQERSTIPKLLSSDDIPSITPNSLNTAITTFTFQSTTIKSTSPPRNRMSFHHLFPQPRSPQTPLSLPSSPNPSIEPRLIYTHQNHVRPTILESDYSPSLELKPMSFFTTHISVSCNYIQLICRI